MVLYHDYVIVLCIIVSERSKGIKQAWEELVSGVSVGSKPGLTFLLVV